MLLFGHSHLLSSSTAPKSSSPIESKSLHHYWYLFISLWLMGKSPLLELLIFSILRRRLVRFEFLKMCFRGLALLISPNHLRSPSAPPEPLDPPDLQIRLLSGEAHALLLPIGFQRVHRESKPPSLSPSRLAPHRRKFDPPFSALRRTSCRRRLLLSRSANLNLGFSWLGQWMVCLLGQWMVCLVGQKGRVFLLGLTTPTLNPLFFPYRSLLWFRSLDKSRLKPSHLSKPRLPFSFIIGKSACSFAVSVTILPLPFPQVCSSSSLSVSSTLGSYWMSVESVALVLWNPGLVLTILKTFDTIGSTFVLSGGTLIALVRIFTAICRFYSELALLAVTLIALVRNFTAVCRFYFELALLEVSLLQIVKRYLLSFTVPVNLVHRGSRSPHLSFKELIILPNTSLVVSGIVIGSIVVKIVLLGAEARIVVQDFSRSAIADWLTLEALCPLPCGFGKDYRVEEVCHIDGLCLVSTLALSSLSVYLSFVAAFSLLSYSITLLVVVLVGALSSFVSSFNGG